MKVNFVPASVRELDQRMQQVERARDAATVTQFKPHDESSWAREKEIEQIVTAINRLLVVPDGKHCADSLKLKDWMNPLPVISMRFAPVLKSASVFIFMTARVSRSMRLTASC